MHVELVKLETESVRLEPIGIKHLEGLCEIGLNEDIWRWFPYSIKTSEDMRQFIENAITEFESGTSLAFSTVENATNKIIGSTRFMNIDVQDKRVEIGSTWINPGWQRTSINTEAKLIMLTHAFEIWKCIRVELKTDALNEKSRNAILRIGAKEEGILRQHMITESGRFRDSIFYSIIDSEWQNVKADLESKLRSF